MATTSQISRFMREQLSQLYPEQEVQAIIYIVLQDVLNYSPVDTVLRADFEQDDVFVDRIKAITARLLQHEPLQYILGRARFHGHDFMVTPATLIPRPETERLVDIIVDRHGNTPDLKVLDMGTGSGCIAISLARALKFAQVDATDISAEALAVARQNATALKARVQFMQDDILNPDPQLRNYDIIVSNPPYICLSERAAMEPNVLRYEPASALFVPDDDPLRYYRAIVFFALNALVPHGWLYLEINRRFPQEMQSLLTRTGFTDVRIINDQYGNPRFATATLL